MRVLMAGGGTGGHITPNIALIRRLRKKADNLKFLYLGSQKGMESVLIPAEGIDFKAIKCGKLRRYFDWRNFSDLFLTLYGIMQSFYLIFVFKPDVIFCKGGYVSLPVAVAGGLLGKKVIIHESDFVPGLANRLSARFASLICVSFKDSAGFFKNKQVAVTGNPVRDDLAGGNKSRAMKLCGFSDDKKVILVMGGSQGAASVNEMLFKQLDKLLHDYQVIHLCGKGKMAEAPRKKGYFAMEYANEELKDLYALADAVISRSGANSLAELAYLNKAAVLIPLSQGSRGDQIGNAIEFAKEHRAIIIDERKDADLVAIIDDLFRIKLKTDNMTAGDGASAHAGVKLGSADAAEIISELILKYAKNSRGI